MFTVRFPFSRLYRGVQRFGGVVLGVSLVRRFLLFAGLASPRRGTGC